ncbi:MAG TPA: Dabb family protein [Pseudonocardiaceae bacterium]|nr:Dabb family protein [Pseudonocardiaceae bacterium]
MIRNVVVGRLREPDDPQAQAMLKDGLAAIAALTFPGLLSMHVGATLALRSGGWSFAITNDWTDVDSYRVYDTDEEHNRLRREVFAVICEDIARVQFELPA